MLIGFHLGMARAVNAITSSISRSDGRGGKMWVARARYSLIRSFWSVTGSPARRAGRKVGGAAREVFLDHSVLARAGEPGETGALPLGDHDVEGEQPGR